MSVKCKYKDIKEIYDWCDRYASEEDRKLLNKQLNIRETAYYTPSQANWSYIMGLVKVGDNVYEVVEVFGAIKEAIDIASEHFKKEQLTPELYERRNKLDKELRERK